MKRKPDGFSPCLCPFNPVARMGRDEEIIAGLKNANVPLPVKEQAGASREKYNPLVPVLVVPLTWRRCLSC